MKPEGAQHGRLKLWLLSAVTVCLMAVAASAAQPQSSADKALAAALAKYRGLDQGKNADYIPALAKVDPHLYGIALVTVDGQLHGAGDVTTEVSLQSISQAFVSIGALDDFAGRPLALNQEVYRSESELHAAADLEARQRAVNVNAKDLATMAATLANGGRNPLTHKQVIDPARVPAVLAAMATGGLHGDSGQWLLDTGLPATSGAGGGLLAVSPGRFGVAVISPPLDAAGNSVRGQSAIRDISSALSGNPYASLPR